MQFAASFVIAYLAVIGTAAPAPLPDNGNVKSKDPSSESFVDFYYKAAYPASENDKRGNSNEKFVDPHYTKAPPSTHVDKRESHEGNFVDFYYKKTDLPSDIGKREPDEDSFVDFYYKKSYAPPSDINELQPIQEDSLSSEVAVKPVETQE